MRILAAGLLLLSLASIGFAQFETAVVLGTVRDASQAVIPDAKVTLVNLETGITATMNSDSRPRPLSWLTPVRATTSSASASSTPEMNVLVPRSA